MAVSMAVADEWNTDVIHKRFLRSSGKIPSKATRYGPALHVSCVGCDAFFFPFGCLVIWNGDKDDEEFYKATAGAGSVGLKRTPVVSRTRWVTGDETAIGSDIIVEGGTNGLHPVMERLAISYALAQGVKLRALNTFLRDAVKNTEHISEELAQTGYISTSKKEVSKLSGKLFMERLRYHIGDDMLEIPDFLLENEEYLPHYRRMERRLEMRERGLTLTARYEALQAFYGLLSDEITHQYSIGLELAITVMIAFEIFLSLMALAKQSLRSVFSVCALFLGVSLILWGLWRAYRRRSVTSAVQKYGGSSRSWG